MHSEAVNTQEEVAGDHVPPAVTNVTAVSCVAKTAGPESPATPMEVAMGRHSPVTEAMFGLEETKQKPRKLQKKAHQVPMTSSEVTHVQNEQRRERYWRRLVHNELRDRLVAEMMEQLVRITGGPDIRHLRLCASRYESFVWKKSANQVQYKQKLEHRIESLRRQPSHGENGEMKITVRLVEGHRLNLIRSSSPSLPQRHPVVSTASVMTPPGLYGGQQMQQVDADCPQLPQRHSSSQLTTHRSSSSCSTKRAGKRKMHQSLSLSLALDASLAQRDEMYFAKLRVMKNQYRDEVALVFRELCRVNTVIQHSASLRRHDSTNLADFLANLKKIIYLLEQQPGEVCGMIPVRKRAVEYLDVVEFHIQRKVLPILHRLRHTYSTILRPIVLNYMKNNFRFNRRL